MRKMQTKVVEKIKTHNLCSIALFRKSLSLWDNVGKKMVQHDRLQMTIYYSARALHAR